MYTGEVYGNAQPEGKILHNKWLDIIEKMAYKKIMIGIWVNICIGKDLYVKIK
jgi:hypothetical protein